MQILDRQKLPYELREYEEAELSADEAARKLGLPLDRVFKTLVVQGDRAAVVLACLPGSHTLDLKALARASGNKRCDLVPVADIHRLTGYLRGGVSPHGSRKPYPLFLDESAHQHDTISVSPGMRVMQMLISPEALIAAGNAKTPRLTAEET